jgi:RNA polymerase sigma factor (sigma-70 family)
VSAESERGRIAEYFRTEKNRLVNYVRRWVQDTVDRDSEDIVQDVMTNIFNAADITAPIENLSAYIYRSLYNRIVDGFRRKRFSLSLEDSIVDQGELTLKDTLSDVRYDVHRELERKEIREKIHNALGGLSSDQRRVFIATEFEGRSYRELSAQWDIPVGTLLSQKHRAVQKIRSALESYISDTKE